MERPINGKYRTLAGEIVLDGAGPLATLEPVAERAKQYAAEARSDATRTAYARQWRRFAAWCEGHGLDALPAAPATVVLYLTTRADEDPCPAVATLAQGLSAISQAHQSARLPSPRAAPEVREVWQGIRRSIGVAPEQAVPLFPEQLRVISRALPDTLIGVRDRALLLVGFAAALRRSELVDLDVDDVFEDADGYVANIRRSKMDQEGKGQKVGIPFGGDPATCPVRSLRAWLEASSVTEGAIFVGVRHGRLTGKKLHGRDVSRIVQRSAERAGVDPAGFSGHSLRAGLATSAAKAGKSMHSLARQTRHKSLAQLQTYIRDAQLFDENAAAGIGL